MVCNVVDFGVFVDIGVKYDGLVYLLWMVKKYLKDLYSLLVVGDIVIVWVYVVDKQCDWIQLIMLLLKKGDND